MSQDFYSTLGVSQQASDEEIKKAMRRHRMRLHPDREDKNASKAEKAKRKEELENVEKAYKVLSNAEQRTLYDQVGHASFERAASGQSQDSSNQFNFSDVFNDFDINSIFKEFGSSRQSRGSSTYAQRGSDLRYDLAIDLKATLFGKQVNIQIPRLGSCQQCLGSGSQGNAKPITCSTCKGSGNIYAQYGPFRTQQTCSDCQGQGQQRTSPPCLACRGSGQVREMRTLKVDIPIGVYEGHEICLKGEGEAGIRGGSTGDLYVRFHLNTHTLFKRKGNDLYADMPLSYETAALGGTIEVPTLEGKIRLQVPPATQNGKILKLRGKGVPQGGYKGAGDLYLTLTIELPSHLNQEQIHLLQKFKDSLKDSNKHYPSMNRWQIAVKDFFTL